MKEKGAQFEDMVFPGLGSWGNKQRTARASVPLPAEGHTRLWRSTDQPQLASGHWASRPLTGYGSSMLYMDVPHEKLTPPIPGTKSEHYLFGRDEAGRRTAMPGAVNQVQFHSEKEYEHGDWNEYRERWG